MDVDPHLLALRRSRAVHAHVAGELEHVLRAAGSIADRRALVVVGSQATRASHPRPPDELTQSMKVDLYPLDDPGLAKLIDGTIGEGSPFHETFGHYAHGVGPETTALPPDWRSRAVEVSGPSTAGATGICPRAEDVLLSKLAAGREKDFAFVVAAVRAGLASVEALVAGADAYGPGLASTLAARDRRAGASVSG